MKDFLSEYINSLNGFRQTSIHEILSSSTLGKQDLDVIATKLTNTQKQSPIIIGLEPFNGLIDSVSFDGTTREVARRLLELYNTSNDISLLLDSHTAILTSEIKALEDELSALEKAINNYAFTLADNGFYDYSFTETFNDDTMRETSLDVGLSDRSGIDFSADEQALVNGVSGTLTLNTELKSEFPLNGAIINSNCMPFVTSNTGISNSLNASVSNGWRVALSAPKPISSSLPGASISGAQILLELTLANPAPCNAIVLTPFSDLPVDILEVRVFNQNDQKDSAPVVVLSDRTPLDRSFTINFPMMSVAKFTILINQSTYKRGEMPPAKAEIVYRDFYGSIQNQRKHVEMFMGKQYNKNRKALKRVFLKTRNLNETRVFKAELPSVDFEATHGPLTLDKIINREKFSRNSSDDIFRYQSKINTFMRRMIDENVFASNPQIVNDRKVYNVNITTGSNTFGDFSSNQTLAQNGIGIQGVEAPLNANILSYASTNQQTFLDYQYNIGLRNIRIGYGSKTYRGVFITKQIPAPTDSGEVKLKSDEVNMILVDSSRDSKLITSFEYSISNKSNPKGESDWLPILPIGDTQIQAERLFITEAGVAILRFPADQNSIITVYKNGYSIDLSSITLISGSDVATIKGLRFPVNSYLSTDIFTVDYTPAGDQTVINFAQKGFGQSLLASAFDDNGAGESFNGTDNNQIITLKNEPYIDYSQANTKGTYSATLGFVGTYQPITIVLSSGVTALNQTNYIGKNQNNLSSFNSSKTAYIHSGNNIIFNRPITERFTVYYQYIPSNLRLRVVMRVNNVDYVSPILNSVQVKTKTLKPDARKVL